MTGNSPGGSPTVNRRNDLLNQNNIKEQAIQQQILQVSYELPFALLIFIKLFSFFDEFFLVLYVTILSLFRNLTGK